jgi:hypothetical protein
MKARETATDKEGKQADLDASLRRDEASRALCELLLAHFEDLVSYQRSKRSQ